jgi:hypothetical protein
MQISFPDSRPVELLLDLDTPAFVVLDRNTFTVFQSTSRKPMLPRLKRYVGVSKVLQSYSQILRQRRKGGAIVAVGSTQGLREADRR